MIPKVAPLPEPGMEMWPVTVLGLLKYNFCIHKCNGWNVWSNGTTREPKFISHLVLDKVRFCVLAEVSISSFVFKIKVPNKSLSHEFKNVLFIGFSLFSPTKVEACKSFLFTQSYFVLKIKNNCVKIELLASDLDFFSVELICSNNNHNDINVVWTHKCRLMLVNIINIFYYVYWLY